MIGTVNALLLVQMLHFLVAYLILKYLFLNPGLAVMNAQDDIDQGLKRDLALVQEEVSRQEGLAKDQWKRHCGVLYSRMPVEAPVVQQVVARVMPTIVPLSGEEEKKLRVDVERTIIDRILREQ